MSTFTAPPALRGWRFRKVRRQVELMRLEHLIAENDARLAEIERERNAPCRLCEEKWPITVPAGATTDDRSS